MEEKRKEKRLVRYLDVIEQTTGKLLGHTGDIHYTGLLLVSTQEIPLLMDIPIWLELPGEEGIKNRVSLDINGIWSQKNINPDFYNTGCWIVNPPLNTISAIEKLIEDLTP